MALGRFTSINPKHNDLFLHQEANDELEAVLMNRSLEQGKAVLSQTREGTSIEAEMRNMDDSQASFFAFPQHPKTALVTVVQLHLKGLHRGS